MGGFMPGDPGGQAEAAALKDGLAEHGWKLRGNIELNYYWPGAWQPAKPGFSASSILLVGN
jgi:hypothetical protein